MPFHMDFTLEKSQFHLAAILMICLDSVSLFSRENGRFLWISDSVNRGAQELRVCFQEQQIIYSASANELSYSYSCLQILIVWMSFLFSFSKARSGSQFVEEQARYDQIFMTIANIDTSSEHLLN